MPRGQHVGLVRSNRDINAALENVLKYHVVAVRRRADGSLSSVKHIQWGWMNLQTYYQLQKLHEVGLPLLKEVIQGGYRLKAAIWTSTIGVVPVGTIIVAVAAGLFAIDYARGDFLAAALDLLALLLPFGELWLIWHGSSLFWSAFGKEISGGISEAGKLAGGFFTGFGADLKGLFGPGSELSNTIVSRIQNP